MSIERTSPRSQAASRASDHPGPIRLDSGAFPLERFMCIDPQAFGQAFLPMFFGDEPAPSYAISEGVAILSIDGPLLQRGGWLWEGYDDIRSRFGQALADPKVNGVLLQISSPGGSAAGCFEAAKAMTAAKVGSGKPVYAYADELAASAAYAMACVADEIYLPEAGSVGSVGCIAAILDETKFNERMGFRVSVITSGTQKADGHPDVPISEEVLKRYQARIDVLANIFAGFVGESRKMDPAKVISLQGAVFTGQAAAQSGLADGVVSLDGAFAQLREKANASAKARVTREKRTMNVNGNAAQSGSEVRGELLVSALDMKPFALALGLPHTASENDIIGRASAMSKAHGDVLRATGTTSIEAALASIESGKIAHNELGKAHAKLAELQAQETARDVDASIEAAKREGKILNEAHEGVMRALGKDSPAHLKSLLATMPVTVTTRETASREPSATPAGALDPKMIRLSNEWGLSQEDLDAATRDDRAMKGGR